MSALPITNKQNSKAFFSSFSTAPMRSDRTSGIGSQLHNMTQTEKSQEVVAVREDDHYIEFGDTRSFAAEKWRTAVEAQEIRAPDWSRARDADTYEEFGVYLRRAMQEPGKTPKQKSSLQSLLNMARPVYGFINAFEKLILPEKVDMSIIWGLLYLNIAHALPQPEKLKYITTWLLLLRRSFESLSQCIANCSDENSARTQATDVFDPMLTLLTDLLRYQRSYIPEPVFIRELPKMRETVKQYIDEIENVIYHFRQIAQHTREQQELNSKRSAFRGIPFRGEQQNPYDRAAFPVDNLPDIRTSNFFGREAIIERINERLGNAKDEKLRTYLIYGLRGVGKTQIALEYAHRYSKQFDAIFWVRCETSASLRQSFSEIAIQLELSTPDQATRFEENQIKVLEWLKKTDKFWLLIYDNAEREQALNAYWPRDAVGSVLLTSRSYYNFEHNERREGETIPVFTVDERWELLMELLGTDWQHRHLGGMNGVRERQAAHKLLDALDGLALAIAQAANLVRETRITRDNSIVTVLELFEQTSKTLPPRLFGHRNARIHALDTIMAIALNNVSKNARSLLGTFALLAPDSIPIDLFLPTDQSRLDGRLEFCRQDYEHKLSMEAAAREENDYVLFLEAAKRKNEATIKENRTTADFSSARWTERTDATTLKVPTISETDSANWSQLSVAATVKDLANLEANPHTNEVHLEKPQLDSLTSFKIHESDAEKPQLAVEMSPKMFEAIAELKKAQLIRQDGRTFVIHRVIQEAMNFTDMEDLQTVFSATVELLHEAFPVQLLGRPLVDVWPTCQKYVQHVVHITKAFASHLRAKKGYLSSTFHFIQLLSNCGWYLYEVADYAECVEMTNVACSAYDDKRSLLYSHLVNILGSAYYEKNQMKKARTALQEARELREILLPENHPQIATALSNLGNVETSDGNLEDAQELFERAARIKQIHGEDEAISLGMSFLQLGRVAAANDDTFGAIKRYDKAEACWIRHPEQSQQFMAYLHYARGNLELNRPDITQATMQYEKCRDVCYQRFPVHPLAAAAHYKLALCEMGRGRRYYDKALSHLEKAYNIATVRSGGETDGTVARIQWKRAEIMIDDYIQRAEGLKVRDGLKLDLQEIATELDLQLQPEWTEDEAFDMLVPGFFR